MVLCVTCFMQLKRAVETLIACVCESEKVREMAKNSIKKAKIKIVLHVHRFFWVSRHISMHCGTHLG